MQKRAGFRFITKIDISMGFYTFALTPESQSLCVIVTPFGLYKYLRLPMGIANSPDFFQSVMHPLFDDMSAVECFIDDIAIFTKGSFLEHLTILTKVLRRLEDAGFTVNPLKCEWAVTSTEYLGFFLTIDGLKPMPKKVEAIINVSRPSSTKEVRSFVGLVNYYKDMRPRRAHILAPLTELCSTRNKFKWNDNHESSFQQMKKLVSGDVLLRFPDHSKPFQIYTDASKYQLGATIKQDNKPIAYFSKKLNPAQRRYSTIEQEMLAIVTVLKEYKSFLYGGNVIIHTDHKISLAETSANDRVFRWKQKIEEFGPLMNYIKGQKNVETDALSRLPSEAHFSNNVTSMINQPSVDPNNPLLNKNPLALDLIQTFQEKEPLLIKAVDYNKNYFYLPIFGRDLIVHQNPNHLAHPKIVVPFKLRYPVIMWFHSILGHAGVTRLHATLSSHFWFPHMQEEMNSYIKCCPYCQRYNKQTKAYGHLPPKDIFHLNPWDDVCVDMIGLWKITIEQTEYFFRALTCIDSVINLPEIFPVENASSHTVAIAFEDGWLSRYPSPKHCLHDNGNEFLGFYFTSMLEKNNIQSVPTTIKNPQSNAIVERMHQTINTMIAISLQENPPRSVEEGSYLIHRKCAAAQYAVRATVHSRLHYSPGELAFGRNMLHPFASPVDWNKLINHCQELINKSNMRENMHHQIHDYKINDLVIILDKANQRGKLAPSVLPEGPWKIQQVHTNGAVTILGNNYLERMNIRRICPFF